jgi:hypothetical protein
MYAVARGGLLLTGAGSGILDRAVILALVGGAALAAYLGVAFVLRTEEVGSSVALLRSRTAKSQR